MKQLSQKSIFDVIKTNKLYGTANNGSNNGACNWEQTKYDTTVLSELGEKLLELRKW